MATTTDLEEQIWHEEVKRLAEDTEALWKTQYRFWLRAKAQGAPVTLLNELSAISEIFKEANNRLVELAICFPKAEK